MANSSLKNNRCCERFEIAMQIKLIYPDGSVRLSTTRNLSEGGMFVILPKTDFPPLGEMVTFYKIDGQDVTATLVNDTAVVVHIEDDGIGLAFVDLSLS
jgi:c-di-GMP-binding flagellar brake protein YcgR